MTPVCEREPAPRRRAHYTGDIRDRIDCEGRDGWVGPDRRGVLWRPCHADYDAGANVTTVIFKPIPRHELEQFITEMETGQ